MIIDTMVFAYSLLKVEGKCEEATQILAQSDIIIVPDSLLVELANVAWQWVKYRESFRRYCLCCPRRCRSSN